MRSLLISFLALLLIGVAVFSWQVIEFTSTGASDKDEIVVFEVEPGAGLNQVIYKLKRDEIIKDDFRFKIYSRFFYPGLKIRVGEYRLNKRDTPKAILDTLSKGNSIAYSLTIPEGFNMFEITDMLNSKWPGRGDEFLKLARDAAFVEKLVGEKFPSLEGYLFPDTYVVTKYTTAEALIRKMYESFLEAYEKAIAGAAIRMNRHAHVTLASVIEKETGAPSERPMIASVFHNRLEKKMRLQSDPTIIYGIWVETGQEKGNITKTDILRPTEYNTYTVNALPLGPIANPGLEALKATVNPDTSKNLYFVSRNDGTHVFSETYAAHNQAVRAFQLNRKAREGKSWRDLNKKKPALKQ